jgi:hypothetical protein
MFCSGLNKRREGAHQIQRQDAGLKPALLIPIARKREQAPALHRNVPPPHLECGGLPPLCSAAKAGATKAELPSWNPRSVSKWLEGN